MPVELASVSKQWSEAVKQTLDYLFQSYERSTSLKPYVISALQMHQKILKSDMITKSKSLEIVWVIQRIKLVFHNIMREAKLMGYQREPFNMQMLLTSRLETISQRIKEKEAMYRKIFVLNALKMNSTLGLVADPLPLENEQFKIWLNENVETLRKMTELSLCGVTLIALAIEIKYMTSLQKLYLSNNGIIALPKEIGFLTQLEELNLSRNCLTAFPKAIESLIMLKVLDISKNTLTVLPSELGSLVQLIKLYVYKNQLTALPNQIGSLVQLQVLLASDNILTSLPSETQFLTQLKLLDLSQNKLTALPTEVESLTQLDILYLSDNKIECFPNWIGHLVHMNNGSFRSDKKP
jgi:Leucine-rich repeat (LRR) protein